MSEPTTVSFFFSELYRDYLISRAGIAEGVPTVGRVPVISMDDARELQRPHAVIAVKEDGSKGYKRVLVVSCVLCTELKSSDPAAADVATQTTRKEASAWLRSYDDCLRDHDSFVAWLSAQPAERREGWTMMKHPIHEGEGLPIREGDTRKINYPVSMRVHLAVSRLTA